MVPPLRRETIQSPSRGSGSRLFAMMVPVRAEKCLQQARQRQGIGFLQGEQVVAPQWGQTGPSGQRRRSKNLMTAASSGNSSLKP